MKNLHRDIGQNIRKLRVERCLRPIEIAKKLDISIYDFIEMEKGMTALKLSTLRKLAEILNVALETLVSPTEEMIPTYQVTAKELEQQIKEKETDIKRLLTKIIDLYDELQMKGKF